MITIALILSVIPLFIKLIDNVDKWRNGTAVNHNRQWVTLALSEIPAVIFFTIQVNNFVVACIVSALMIASWFWFLFDGFYNIIRRWHRKKHQQSYKYFTWWYTGTNDNDDATTDNILQRLTLWQHITLKLSLIILFTLLYINPWNLY